MVVRQYDIYLVNLDPVVGAEMRKTRPCVVIAPDEMNGRLRTTQIAPLTANTRCYPWRIAVNVNNKAGSVALDQIRTIDQQRLVKHLGTLSNREVNEIKLVIQQMLID